MADTALQPLGTESPAGSEERVLVGGIALASFSALLLELGLTRLFSVVLFYHFAFLAISIALLGLGAGGVSAYLTRRFLQVVRTRVLAGWLCLANACSIAFLLYVVLHIPVSLELTRWNMFHLTEIYLVSAVPFFFTGLLFSVVFARESTRIPLLYGADLVGGALACLSVVPLLNWMGGPNSILLAAGASAVAAAVWTPGKTARRIALGAAVCLLVVVTANYSGRLIDVIYAKGERRNRWNETEMVKWNAISRIEVDQVPGQTKWIVIDADASTPVVGVDAHHW